MFSLSCLEVGDLGPCRDPGVAAASLQLQLCDRLDMACCLTSFQQLEEAVSAAEGREALMAHSSDMSFQDTGTPSASESQDAVRRI